jgi:hypothetical protein
MSRWTKREWYAKAAEKGDSEAKTYLEKLSINEAGKAGRYAEALQLQEALAAKVEAAETKRDGKAGGETVSALYNVAWYALFAGEFTKALTAADRVHALLPDNLEFEINRAHALMFVERREVSKALYLAHKGKPLNSSATPIVSSRPRVPVQCPGRHSEKPNLRGVPVVHRDMGHGLADVPPRRRVKCELGSRTTPTCGGSIRCRGAGPMPAPKDRGGP